MEQEAQVSLIRREDASVSMTVDSHSSGGVV
jgi:hypothetical protein